MKKRFCALALCLALVLSLTVPTAWAEEKVFFTAMGESILPLTDETMPFLSGSTIYIPTSSAKEFPFLHLLYNTCYIFIFLIM